MKRPVIFQAARIRLGEIWDYTAGRWDEEQADRYLRQLGTCMEHLCAQRHLWRSVSDRRLPDVFFIRCAHHFIFFRELAEELAVISILHESMDIVQRLREDTGEES